MFFNEAMHVDMQCLVTMSWDSNGRGHEGKKTNMFQPNVKNMIEDASTVVLRTKVYTYINNINIYIYI